MVAKEPNGNDQFDQVLRRSLSVLECLHQSLNTLRTSAVSSIDQLEILHLASLAVLARQRGQHLVVGAEIPPTELRDGPIPEALSSVHDELITRMPTPAPFSLLQFISEIGVLVQGMTRHVERH